MKQFSFAMLAAVCSLLFLSASSQPDQKGLMFTTSSDKAYDHFREGLRYADLGDNRKARAEFQKALSQDKGFTSAYVFMASIAQTPEQFVYHLEKARENLKDANEWEKLFFQYVETDLQNDLNKQLALAKKMVVQFPEAARSYYYLAQTQSSHGMIKEARENFRKALDIEKKWPAAYLALAASYMNQKPIDLQKAEALSYELVRITPGKSAHIMLGDAYRAQGKLDLATKSYINAIQMDPDSPEGFYKRGHVHVFQGNFDKARLDYIHAKEMDDQTSFAHQLIANSYLFEGKPEKAMAELIGIAEGTMIEQDEQKARIAKLNLFLSAALIALHMRDGKKLSDLISRIEPLQNQAYKAIGTKESLLMAESNILYWKGMTDLLSNNADAALAKAESMKTVLDPVNNPRKLAMQQELMGCIAMAKNEHSKAIGFLEKANQQNMYTRYLLAKAYEGAGMKDKADQIYKELSSNYFSTVANGLLRPELAKRK